MLQLITEHLLKLSKTALNLNLMEVYVVLAANVEAKNVVQFVKDNKQLKKLNMKVYKNNEVIAEALQEEFGD